MAVVALELMETHLFFLQYQLLVVVEAVLNLVHLMLTLVVRVVEKMVVMVEVHLALVQLMKVTEVVMLLMMVVPGVQLAVVVLRK